MHIQIPQINMQMQENSYNNQETWDFPQIINTSFLEYAEYFLTEMILS